MSSVPPNEPLPANEQGSDVLVTDEGGGAAHALFPSASVLLTSGSAGWRDISAERLYLSLETPEHQHVGHFLTLPLGPPALVESQEDGRQLAVWATPGEFTLTGEGVSHRVRYEDADLLALSLSSDLVRRVAQEIGKGAAADTGAIEFIPQYGTRDPQVERIGLLLKAELEAGCPTGPLFAEGMGQALAAHLLQRYWSARIDPTVHSASVGLSAARLRRTLDFIEANLSQDISLRQLAAVADLSPYHFARQFKAATGLAPHAFLIARRVERAKELLRRTDHPIASIAAAVGFSHQSHLNRHFNRLVGVTPARFR